MRILFDRGSQRTFITEALRQQLGLRTERADRICIKTFGNDSGVTKLLDVVKLKVRHKKKNFFIDILFVIIQS